MLKSKPSRVVVAIKHEKNQIQKSMLSWDRSLIWLKKGGKQGEWKAISADP